VRRDRAWRRLSLLLAVAAVFWLGPPYGWLPSSADQELNWTLWQHIPGAAYVWLGLGLLAALAVKPERLGNALSGRGQ
jgi:alpha-1,2-mannosyltransferase